MQIVNIHEAKTHLSRLIESAVRGEPFIIARAGKPLVEVRAIDGAYGMEPKRLGFMTPGTIPEDFDAMGEGEIATRFSGEEA
ncbi:MAG: type II toxin-antitoxin system prevent-host-death family antitoxin [Geminicoccaceae bacterium]|nr:type II toxin-antitoxin system prevent-host-death family antitoxin [Geminicoccaceae bacterium]